MHIIFDNLYEDFSPLKFRAAKRKLERWSTVLNAKQIPNRQEQDSEGWFISVPENFVEQAEKEITLYEIENQPLPPEPEKLTYKVNKPLFFLFLSLIVAFHFFTKSDPLLYDWVSHGKTSAELIVKGEIWRTATALTLHGDIKHVLSNVILGGVIVYGLARLIGSGSAWFLTLFSGIFGNLLNALFYQSMHNSIGASTAVFGAIGIIGSVQIFSKFRYRKIRAWVPFAAALGLLAALGSSETTDIMAHFFGFVSGAFLGLFSGFIFSKTEIPGKLTQFILGFASLFIITAAWIKAFF